MLKLLQLNHWYLYILIKNIMVNRLVGSLIKITALTVTTGAFAIFAGEAQAVPDDGKFQLKHPSSGKCVVVPQNVRVGNRIRLGSCSSPDSVLQMQIGGRYYGHKTEYITVSRNGRNFDISMRYQGRNVSAPYYVGSNDRKSEDKFNGHRILGNGNGTIRLDHNEANRKYRTTLRQNNSHCMTVLNNQLYGRQCNGSKSQEFFINESKLPTQTARKPVSSSSNNNFQTILRQMGARDITASLIGKTVMFYLPSRYGNICLNYWKDSARLKRTNYTHKSKPKAFGQICKRGDKEQQFKLHRNKYGGANLQIVGLGNTSVNVQPDDVGNGKPVGSWASVDTNSFDMNFRIYRLSNNKVLIINRNKAIDMPGRVPAGRGGSIGKVHLWELMKGNPNQQWSMSEIGVVDSGNISMLPFDFGKTVKVTQGNNSAGNLSHSPNWKPSRYSKLKPGFNKWAVDYGLGYGDNIRAVRKGRVISCGWRNGGWGNVALIEYDNKYDGQNKYGHYLHLSSCSVRGGRVSGGQVIGKAGSTGNSTGNHLHYHESNIKFGASVKLPTFAEGNMHLRGGSRVTSKNRSGRN